jgi:four helix bundle protein
MTTSQDKSKQLEERMIQFSLDVIAVCKQSAQNQENQIITNQLIRSATSIGANYAEAINAASKQDFRNKIFISKKEAAETRYWLRLFERVNSGVDVSGVLDESSQLLFILQKIISTLKNGK